MNPKETKIVEDAIAIVENLQAQVGNILKRGPFATKFFATEAKASYQSDAIKKTLVSDVLPALLDLIKRGKPALKDLGDLEKEGSTKRLASYADIKAFRAKAAKLLESSKVLEGSSLKFTMSIAKMTGSDGLYPGMSDVEVKTTITSVENFAKYYNAFRIALAKG